jgi:hypothetical protein
MQVTLAKNMNHGLATTLNYQWASAFDDNTGYWTWSHSIPHMRDSNVRNQQFNVYGSYDLPFGKGKQYLPDANHAEDLLVGGWQLSGTMDLAGGLPFTLGYSNFGGNEDCNHNVGGTAAPCLPNATGHMHTALTSFDPISHTRSYWTPQPTTGGVFSYPGLDVVGNNGQNTYRGPGFFTSDLGLTKAFSVWESVAFKFRMDAFNAFNHITAGNPNTNNIFQNGPISGEGGGCGPGNDCGPRQLEFSLRVQF